MSARGIGEVVWTTVRLMLRLDAASLREAPRWFSTFLPGRSRLREELPWMNYAVVRHLSERLTPRSTVFEYGSGGSTVYWARRAAQVVSVEHDEEWYHRVEDLLKTRSLTNCTYILRRPLPLHADTPAPVRSAAMPDKDFTSYVHTIDAYPDRWFDLVVVDGRARIDCLHRAVPKVKAGGCLVLDNSQRERYAAAVHELSRRYAARRFVGIVPCRSRGFGTTTVWRIP